MATPKKQAKEGKQGARTGRTRRGTELMAFVVNTDTLAPRFSRGDELHAVRTDKAARGDLVVVKLLGGDVEGQHHLRRYCGRRANGELLLALAHTAGRRKSEPVAGEVVGVVTARVTRY